MQMSHDLVDGMTPASALPPSAENHHSNSRPQRRQTVSAVYPTIHATQRDAPLNSARISRASVYGSGVNHSSALASPTLTESPAQRPRSNTLGVQTRFLPAQQQSHLARLDQHRPGAMFVDDPRDAGTATALTSASTSDSPTITTPTAQDMISSPSKTPGASASQPHTSVASAPKLPQSRFNFEYQLPLRRRTLASHSSVIDTPSSLNPTPTPQRTFLYDRPRRSIQGFNPSHGRAPKEPSSLPPSPRFAIDDDSDSALAPDPDSTIKALSPNATKRRKDSFYAQQTLPSVKRRMPSYTATYTEGNDRRRTVNGVNKYATEDGNRTPVADDARSDIFLNIARLDSSRRESLGRSELRRTQPDQPDDSPEKTSIERRGSLPDPRTYRHSTLSTIRSSRQPSSSEVTERPRAEPDRPRQDGTESTLSTTAPSTVWDELEDLKSRIRKLELTGKLPPSSQEAISSASAERPRTATTTVTTVSSSPKRGRKTSTSSPGSDSIPPTNPVHPLLQSALSKAKTVLNKDVFTALEATATDAISLSTTLSTNKAPSGGISVVNGYGPSDRLSRRKADSVCRGLTELCLALSDEQLRRQQASSKPNEDTITQQPISADDETLTPTTPYRRSTAQEPEGLSRRQSTRAASRRSSFANPSGNTPSENNKEVNWGNDTTFDAKQTQSPGSSLPTSRLSRLASLRAQRLQTEDEPAEHRSPHGRSISRSMTDISNQSSAYRAPPRQRFSQGFSASQAPQPQQDQTPRYSAQSQQSQLPQPRTPTASQSGIPLRRTLMTPATSRSNIQAGSRRYGLPSGISTPGKANDDAPISPRQDPSQTRIIAPSAKLAASYTPISRPRTNSFGTTRRFGIRQRPMAISDGAVNSFDDNID
ncbi:LPXTG-motif cell wall anchor domain protein [Aspergillus arachidicola]|uniref:LPXTG-motif cell wall anchor domain protein n=1 Tax=Aspergillus arachidicola TaxID=656916 RepID=A0A2G7FLJ9_9EURO|nr:LPXTG-motif cell wall anchor domain protein [Aspergillus arachidicola]